MYQHFLEFIALWMGVDTLHVYSNKGTCYLTSLGPIKFHNNPNSDLMPLRPGHKAAWLLMID